MTAEKLMPAETIAAGRRIVGDVEGHELSDEQITAIVGAAHNTLVLAGAGTGKTTTINGYVTWLLETGQAEPPEILVLSYTKASAADMTARIERQTGQRIHASTFHSLGLEIIAGSSAAKPNVIDGNETGRIVEETLHRLLRHDMAYRRLAAALMPADLRDKHRDYASDPDVEPPFEDYAYRQHVTHLLDTANTVIQHMRSQGLDIAALRERNRMHGGAHLGRNDDVIDLIAPLHDAYQQHLRDHQGVDFAGMITEAIRCIRAGRYRHPYRYVLIDEYQDMSRPRYALVRALREQRDFNLFCVGDDWQSIYRFAGSDIGLILDFDRTWRAWGPSRMFHITVTRRFDREVIEASGAFVMADPHLYRKELRAMGDGGESGASDGGAGALTGHASVLGGTSGGGVSARGVKASRKSVLAKSGRGAGGAQGAGGVLEERRTIRAVGGADRAARVDAVAEALRALPQEASVLLLGRYRSDLNLIRNDEGSADRARGGKERRGARGARATAGRAGKTGRKANVTRRFSVEEGSAPRIMFHERPDLDITFMTIHRSKGLQRDYVFLLSGSGGIGGFPSSIGEEPLMGLLLPEAERYPHAEERRLCYVAMTRCMRGLFLVVDTERPSRFMYELSRTACPEAFRAVALPPQCPQCGEALRLRAARKDPSNRFYGCSAWPLCKYACDA